MALDTNPADIEQAIKDTRRLLVMVHLVLSDPSQANIDAIVAAASATQTLTLRPSYSAGGVNFSWESYRRSLIDSLPKLYELHALVTGPFEVRSRART
jgi:hypothetical protein